MKHFLEVYITNLIFKNRTKNLWAKLSVLRFIPLKGYFQNSKFQCLFRFGGGLILVLIAKLLMISISKVMKHFEWSGLQFDNNFFI